jgi:O-antigen ligase
MPDFAANSITKPQNIAFAGVFVFFCAALYLFFIRENPIPLVGLTGVVIVALLLNDYRYIYYLFFLTIPYSIEFSLSNGLGTDLPSEPQMWLLFCVGILVFITRGRNIDLSFLRHPISLFMILHLGAIFFTALFSEDPIVSFKFFIAKLWYVIPFFFLPFAFIKDSKIVIKLFKLCIWSLAIGIFIVLVRHSFKGFTFDSINTVMSPFFRNHVTYASISVLILPFVWAMWKLASTKLAKLSYAVLIILYIIGINLSYTRAAMGSVFLAVAAYYVIKFRLVKPILIGAGFVVIIGLFAVSQGNKWLDFAPNFERTISHKKFDNLIEATYKMEDISSMERVHRWVAGAEMVKDKPIFGFGPACFYSFYKPYTLTSFQTYVSDNPEHSGIHCYYLMTLVEQGLFGFLIFIALVAFILLYGENVYHGLYDPTDKIIIMAANICIIIILILNLINDMIEVDKVGTFFFFCASLIVIYNQKISVKNNPVL